MAGDHGGTDIPMEVTAAVAQYTFVMGSGGTGKTVANATAASSNVFGIAQEAATASGDVISIRVVGTSKLKLGGTVNCGDPIVSGAAGVGVASAFASDDKIAAFATEYGVSVDIIEVVLRPITQCN